MGVVYRVGDDVADLLVPYIRERNPSAWLGQIHEAYHLASLGKLTTAQFWDRVGLGHRYPEVELEYLNSRLELTDGFLAAAEELSQHYSLAMLSNDVSEWSRHLRAKWALDKYFDEYVISGDCGIRKPDYGIFEILLSRIGAESTDCVFVDDRPKNLAPAQRMGLNTCLFNPEAISAGDAWNPTISRFAELTTVCADLQW